MTKTQKKIPKNIQLLEKIDELAIAINNIDIEPDVSVDCNCDDNKWWGGNETDILHNELQDIKTELRLLNAKLRRLEQGANK